MSYRVEQDEIVISGFEQGIAPSPYSGISDMRNVDITTIPGEASVGFATVNTQPVVTTATFTADPATDFLTWSGIPTAGVVADTLAITVSNSGGGLPNPLAANTTYYIRNSTSTTFQLSTTINGSIVNITTTGTGTQSFSTVNIGRPTYMCDGRTPGNTVDIYYFFIDLNNRAWWWNGNANFWVFLNNPAGSTFKGCGIVSAYGYLFVFHDTSIDYFQNDLPASTNAWHSNWQTINAYQIHQAILGSTDDFVYFCNINEVGSFFQVQGKTFDPTDSTTYEYNQDALTLPIAESAQCISPFQPNILVGGTRNVVYNWDRVSVGYIPIFIGDNNTSNIVCVNTNAYIFAGVRGRIYITNGAQAQLYKKVPDHISGTVSPLFTWGGATYNRGQLFFSLMATNASGTAINQYGGVWAIDLETNSLRLAMELSYGNYSGMATCMMPIFGSEQTQGNGLFIGWMNTISAETDGVDITTSTPYTAGQSTIDCDMIPIGTALNPIDVGQIMWKTSVPLVANENVQIYYRLDLSQSFTLVPSTEPTLVGKFSEILTQNFGNAQWLQLRSVLTSTASNPSYARLTELRITNYVR